MSHIGTINAPRHWFGRKQLAWNHRNEGAKERPRAGRSRAEMVHQHRAAGEVVELDGQMIDEVRDDPFGSLIFNEAIRFGERVAGYEGLLAALIGHDD